MSMTGAAKVELKYPYVRGTIHTGIEPESVSWIFFCVGAKRTSMRRALATRVAGIAPVVVVERAVSCWRSPGSFGMRARSHKLDPQGRSWIYRPLHFPEGLPAIRQFAARLNRERLAAELDRLIPPGRKRVVCFDSPVQHSLAGRLGAARSLYIAVDDLTRTLAGTAIRGEEECEKKMLAAVDGVICVSDQLAARLRDRGCNSHLLSVLPNAYDETIFDPARPCPEPAALAGIPRPRVLVAGHVSERIDWKGVVEAARLCPAWTWVFVGPVDKGFRAGWANLSKPHTARQGRDDRPRIVWSPPVPVEEVPAWISHSQACAVPYRLNPFTTASDPLKGIEYLAMGAFVLSTRVPAQARFGAAVEWVEEGDGAGYARALDAALATSGREDMARARRASVQADSWAVRSRAFLELVGRSTSPGRIYSDRTKWDTDER